MKLLTTAVGAIAAIALTAGSAAAGMQPVANPPEKAMSGKMHHKKHHHMAKKADMDAKMDKAAAAGDKGAMAMDKKADKAAMAMDKKADKAAMAMDKKADKMEKKVDKK